MLITLIGFGLVSLFFWRTPKNVYNLFFVWDILKIVVRMQEWWIGHLYFGCHCKIYCLQWEQSMIEVAYMNWLRYTLVWALLWSSKSPHIHYPAIPCELHQTQFQSPLTYLNLFIKTPSAFYSFLWLWFCGLEIHGKQEWSGFGVSLIHV